MLLRFLNSQHFSLFMCISYLARYADNIGIHFYLCQKLRTFPFLEIEFFLPQLCQIILTVPTESVALEDFLLEMCNKSTHSAVLVCIRGRFPNFHESPIYINSMHGWWTGGY